MILELDCGNSRIKWRVVCADGRVLFAGVSLGNCELLEALQGLPGLSLRRCRLVSVRTELAVSELVALIRKEFSIVCLVAGSQVSCAGVVNGYSDPARLGVDRWLAILAAYGLAGGGACLVIDVGTAVTVDLVRAGGEHLGGYICPGVHLMIDQLVSNTHGIAQSLAGMSALGELGPGRCTDDAVKHGVILMLKSYIESQLQFAERALGGGYAVFITGGDADLIGPLSVEALIVPDLVFIGLAISCP
jgi:type III pantothenate kinase